jgi:hypothetical protein
MVEMECFLSRHLAGIVVRGFVSAHGWYHAGSWVRRFGDMRMGARLVLCFLATLSILAMLLLRRVKRGPFVGGFHDCKKVLKRAKFDVSGGAAALMMRSVTLAHVGRVGERSK